MSSIITQIGSALATAKPVFSNAWCELYPQLQTWSNYLIQAREVEDKLVEALTYLNDDNALDHAVADEGSWIEVANDAVQSFITIISEAAFIKAKSQSLNVSSAIADNIMWVTTQLGTLVPFYLTSLGNYIVDGVSYEAVVSMITSIPSTITDKIVFIKKRVSDGKYFFNSHVLTYLTDGAMSTILPWANLLNDISVSATINEILNSALSVVSQGTFNIADFNAIVDRFKNGFTAAKTVCYDILEAANVGGAYGVVKYIFSYFEAASTITSVNRVLTFTDNTGLVPQQYITGIVSTIIGAVGAIASTIVAFFNPLVAGAISLITGIISAIPKALNYDYATETLAGLDVTAAFPAMPVAMWQRTVSFNAQAITGIELFDNLKDVIDTSGVCYCEVPGGYIFIGFDDQDSPTAFRFEFHPLYYRSAYYEDLINFYDGALTINSLGSNEVISFYAEPNRARADWENLIRTKSQLSESPFGPDSRNLTDAEDDIAKLIMAVNYVIFMYYLSRDVSSYYTYSANVVRNDGSHTSVSQIVSQYWVDFSGILTQINNTTTDIMHYGVLAIAAMTGAPFTCTFNGQTATGTFALRQVGNSHTLGPSWATMISYCDHYANYSVSTGTIGDVGNIEHLAPAFVSGTNSGFNSLLGSKSNFAICIPKYDRKTFWVWVGLAVGLVVTASVIAVVTATTVKRAIQRRRLSSQLNVERAWTNATATTKEEGGQTIPLTPAEMQSNLQNYYSTVKKTNFFNSIFGGTIYDSTNYWNSGSGSGSFVSGFLATDTSESKGATSFAAILKKQNDSSGSIESLITNSKDAILNVIIDE